MSQHTSFRLTLDNGLLSQSRQILSPNFSNRANDATIDLLIIHNISLPPGQYGTKCIEKLFCNTLDFSEHEYFQKIEGLKVSSHLLIERDGAVIQFVPFDKKAWHAGESSFDGRGNCNEYSIGVELEGTDYEDYTDDQYTRLIEVSRVILGQYPSIGIDRIVGHSDVAPGRKTDPGPHFDWHRFKSGLADHIGTANYEEQA